MKANLVVIGGGGAFMKYSENEKVQMFKCNICKKVKEKRSYIGYIGLKTLGEFDHGKYDTNRLSINVITQWVQLNQSNCVIYIVLS